MTSQILVDAFIFDLDGTLIDSRQDIAHSVNETLSHLGHSPLHLDEISRFVGDGVKRLLSKSLKSDDQQEVDRATRFFLTHYSEHCTDQTLFYPDVRETLEGLRSKQLAVVTNKPGFLTRKILEYLGISDLFRVVIGGDEFPTRKPDPGPVLEVLYRLKVPSSKTVVIGDGPQDMLAGKAAGCHTCAVTYGYCSEKEMREFNPDKVISAFSDILQVYS